VIVYCKLALVKWLNDISAVQEELLCVPACAHTHTHRISCLISNRQSRGQQGKWLYQPDSLTSSVEGLRFGPAHAFSS